MTLLLRFVIIPVCLLTALVSSPTSDMTSHIDVTCNSLDGTSTHQTDNRTKSVEYSNDPFDLKSPLSFPLALNESGRRKRAYIVK